ncbi:peptidoglycan-associated lipoprotein [Hippea maritima]|uniref:Peptidoglycan-associated lipoprotein n=1 Tax=Hippea maritima (strain ATCC 700847 / DSM 10411 / MH2) TaxID=760142 RepID=F2LW19_HIPMA|nr:OmpA family protein [Hippea maritima]AEA33953.1 peptidoglycan-associated lipoprotein [Hippea maritima DSM 10411]
MKRKGKLVSASLIGVAFLMSGCMCMHKGVQNAPKKIVVEKPATTTQQAKVDLKTIFTDIHFNFDKYNLTYINKWGIKQNVPAVLDGIAQYMVKHPNVRIRIEGNCDERGTVEYNLALGQKRALAAKKYLVAKGVNPDRIDIISYGESRPLDPAHNEYAWAKNRRDHFVILSK